MNTNIDMDLHRDVLAELGWEPSVDATSIGVAVQDGVATLTGYVDSYAAKLAAAKAALRVFGVKAVANDIEVRLPGPHARTDADIAQAALGALEWNTSVPKGHVTVAVSKGWVTLDGRVDWQFQKLAAERVVRNLRGVLGLTNLISIKPHVKPQDVHDRIEAAIRRNAELDARRIRVEALDGSITLRGKVRSWAEREEAEKAAWAAPGVSSVDNHILISP